MHDLVVLTSPFLSSRDISSNIVDKHISTIFSADMDSILSVSICRMMGIMAVLTSNGDDSGAIVKDIDGDIGILLPFKCSNFVFKDSFFTFDILCVCTTDSLSNVICGYSDLISVVSNSIISLSSVICKAVLCMISSGLSKENLASLSSLNALGLVVNSNPTQLPHLLTANISMSMNLLPCL